MSQLNPYDIAVAIQDFLDGRSICHFEENRIIRESAEEITSIDISDLNKAIIRLNNGQTFVCRISVVEESK